MDFHTLQKSQGKYYKFCGEPLPQPVMLRVLALAAKRKRKLNITRRPNSPIPRVPWSEIEIGKALGTGSFSTAWTVKTIKNQKCQNFVIKKIKREVEENPSLFSFCAVDLIQEGTLLASLSHPNIISVQGWSSPIMVDGYVNGHWNSAYLLLDRLEEILEDRLCEWEKETPKPWHLPSKRRKMRAKLLEKRCSAAVGLTNAVAYLHSLNVLHRDLKPRNIGFTKEGVLKVFDFDVAREIPMSPSPPENTLFLMTKKVGSPRYMAPEVGRGEPYNLKADVYSFGLLLNQIFSKGKPFEGFDREDIKKRVFLGTERPSIPRELPKPLRDLISRSWSCHVHERPTMKEAKIFLNEDCIPRLLSQEKKKSKDDTTDLCSDDSFCVDYDRPVYNA